VPDGAQGILGCGAHTDWGVLTLLVMDSAGLQLRRNGAWQVRGVLIMHGQTLLAARSGLELCAVDGIMW